MVRRANQLSHFLRTQNHGKSLALLRVGQVLFHVPPFKHLDIQETECADVHNHGIDGKLPVSQEVCVVTPEVIRPELI